MNYKPAVSYMRRQRGVEVWRNDLAVMDQTVVEILLWFEQIWGRFIAGLKRRIVACTEAHFSCANVLVGCILLEFCILYDWADRWGVHVAIWSVLIFRVVSFL